MENASKALIIAGAILLAILIISLGIIIYNQASSVIDSSSTMTELEVTAFNDRFNKFLGSNVRGANVNSLLNTVQNNNISTDEDSRKITVEGDASIDAAGSNIKRAETGKTYKVEVPDNGYTSGGLIHKIKITVNGGSGGTT